MDRSGSAFSGETCTRVQPKMAGWATAIAHELAQPITAIALNGQAGIRWLEAGDVAGDNVRKSLVAIVRSAMRAGEILRSIRALSGEAILVPAMLDLGEVITESASHVEADLILHNIRLRINVAVNTPRVLGHKVLLQQMVGNLLRNGITAVTAVHDRARELRIHAGYDNACSRVILTVEDNGRGIDGDDLDRPFEAFFTTKADGMGVGLPLCRAIVESHGGSIWASRNAGPGASFHVNLPSADHCE